MPVTQTELAAFTDYAEARLGNGGVESMPPLFRDWLAAREREDVNSAIREGIADVDAGRTRPFREFMAEVREVR